MVQLPLLWETRPWQFSLQPNFSIPAILPSPLIWLFFFIPCCLLFPSNQCPCVTHSPKCHLCGFFQTTNAKPLDSPLFTCFRAALRGPTAWNTAIKLTTQPIKVWPAAVSKETQATATETDCTQWKETCILGEGEKKNKNRHFRFFFSPSTSELLQNTSKIIVMKNALVKKDWVMMVM